MRRLFIPPFVDVLAHLLKPGGILRVATDVPGYGDAISAVVAAQGGFSADNPDSTHHFRDAAPTERQIFCEGIGRPYRFLHFIRQTPTT